MRMASMGAGGGHERVDVAVEAVAEADGRGVDEGLEAGAARRRGRRHAGVGEVAHARIQPQQRWQALLQLR